LRNAIAIIYSRGCLQPSGIRKFGNGMSQLYPLRPVVGNGDPLIEFLRNASPMKNPVVIGATKIHDIEPLKQSGRTDMIMKGMMKAGTAHAKDTTLMKASESIVNKSSRKHQTLHP